MAEILKESGQMYKDDLATMIAAFSGQHNSLVIPRVFMDFFGSLEAAMLFHQCLYWSDRTKDSNLWFYKTYAEWHQELGLSEYQVRKSAKLIAAFLETKVRKAGGNPTLHYRVKWDEFSVSFLKFLKERNQRNFRNETKETSGTSLHRLPTETTTEKRSHEVDELFRVRMREKYKGILSEVDQRIDEALAHVNAKKWSNKQLYVQGWLRRDAERVNGGNNGKSRSNAQGDRRPREIYTIPEDADGNPILGSRPSTMLQVQ